MEAAARMAKREERRGVIVGGKVLVSGNRKEEIRGETSMVKNPGSVSRVHCLPASEAPWNRINHDKEKLSASMPRMAW